MNTYEHISQNKWRSGLLILLFPITFAVTAAAVIGVIVLLSGADVQTAMNYCSPYEAGCVYPSRIELFTGTVLRWVPVLWLIAMAWIFLSYYLGDSLILNAAGAIRVTRDNQPELYRLVENLAITRGMPTPAIYIIDDGTLNAFATGRDPQHAVIAFTRGILQKLDRVEVEGVAAHELAHIENRDVRLMLLTVAGISFFTLAGEICLRISLSSSHRREGGKASLLFLIIGLALLLYGYVIAPLIRLALSRQREYQADATAALTTRHPMALANALRKISGDCKTPSLQKMHSMSAMCIANPLTGENGLFDFLCGLTATHPPIKERIRRLEEMAGQNTVLQN